MKGYLLVDKSTIWEDGSRTGAGFNDPPKTWPYPPIGGGTPIDVAPETPAQSGGYGAPVVPARPPVLQAPPAPVSPAVPVAQVNQPTTAPQGVAVGEPAPGTSPPPPPPDLGATLSAYHQELHTWWGGLSNGTKIGVGAVVAGGVIALLARGSSTP